jgi:hypothetical protein
MPNQKKRVSRKSLFSALARHHLHSSKDAIINLTLTCKASLLEFLESAQGFTTNFKNPWSSTTKDKKIK